MNPNVTNILITIDVETSIGGAFANPKLKPVGSEKRIYGKIGNSYYGIPLIIDILNKYQLKATFFVEVLNIYYFGEKEIKEVCQYIYKRGHDVQLHLHPNYLSFKYWNKNGIFKKIYPDNLSCYSLNEQVNLIAEGKTIFKKITGKLPIVFRAGNYGANNDTLLALSRNEIFLDSSYNAAFNDKPNRIQVAKQLNDLYKIDDLWEIPITNFVQFSFLKFGRLKPLDISAVSFAEIKKLLKTPYKLIPKTIVLILHSFSFVQTRDIQYNECWPNYLVIRRFSQLCSYFQKTSNRNKTLTFSDIYEEISHNSLNHSSYHIFPSIGIFRSTFGQLQQVSNHFI